MRRFIHVFVLLAMLASSALLSVSAAGANQDDAFGDLGLPELNVNITDTAFEGIPEEIEAGRYFVTVTASEASEFGGGVAFVKPEGMSAQEFLDALAGPPDVAGADASPALEAESGDGEEMGGAPPEFLYQLPFAGGIYAPPGETKQVVLDLTPGEWVAWGDDPEAPQEPLIVTVTGEMPADLAEPEADATITMAEYSIEVTEGQLTPGQQIVKVTNVGAQPHFVFIAQGPDSMTGADIEAILEADMTGTPAASGINPDEDFIDAGGTGTQSMGTDIWIMLDLQPGTYVMICFFPDIESGLPHAYDGMYNIIEVSE